MCQEKSCKTSRCRRLRHHGVAVPEECPRCFDNPARVMDYVHILGVACGRCGHYWIPGDVPADLLASAEPWEIPAPSTPAA